MPVSQVAEEEHSRSGAPAIRLPGRARFSRRPWRVAEQAVAVVVIVVVVVVLGGHSFLVRVAVNVVVGNMHTTVGCWLLVRRWLLLVCTYCIVPRPGVLVWWRALVMGVTGRMKRGEKGEERRGRS